MWRLLGGRDRGKKSNSNQHTYMIVLLEFFLIKFFRPSSRKSSLVRLLFKFYETNSGDIFIGGQSIKDVDLDSLRRSIAIVPQVRVLVLKII